MIKKIMCIFGTRPEAIKMAPVIKQLKRYPKKVKPIVCITAQHRDMLDDVLKTFNIRPDYDLNIMEDNQSPNEVTAKTLLKINKVLQTGRPDIILIQGDTTTTLAIALAAFYLKIPVGHIEAGLRSDNKLSPFPEEVNRRLTTTIADFHFAPTERARRNLTKEGIDEKNIFVTGNTVIDALLCKLNNIKKQKNRLSCKFPYLETKYKTILVTAHRRESFGRPLTNICYALREIVIRNNNVQIVYPVHPNPNVQSVVRKVLSNMDRVHLVKPLDYVSFVYLISKSYLILTDSGGIQEEAPSLGKPVLVIRDITERPEALEAGAAILVGTETGSIISNVEGLLNNKTKYLKMSKVRNPFGDGRASVRIVKILLSFL